VVIGVELQGHGHTPDTGRAMSIDRFVDDVAELIDRVAGGGPVDVGLSLGAFTATSLALRHPAKVRRLVLAASNIRPDGYHPEITAPEQDIDGEVAGYGVAQRHPQEPADEGAVRRSSMSSHRVAAAAAVRCAAQLELGRVHVRQPVTPVGSMLRRPPESAICSACPRTAARPNTPRSVWLGSPSAGSVRAWRHPITGELARGKRSVTRPHQRQIAPRRGGLRDRWSAHPSISTVQAR